ncbi:MAG: hypothetical protein ACI8RA_001033, partial [Chlamydiales bacterium]
RETNRIYRQHKANEQAKMSLGMDRTINLDRRYVDSSGDGVKGVFFANLGLFTMEKSRVLELACRSR